MIQLVLQLLVIYSCMEWRQHCTSGCSPKHEMYRVRTTHLYSVSLHVSFLSPAAGVRANPRRSIFRRRSRWFLSASGGSSATGGGGESRDRRAVYIPFAYRLGVGRLEVSLPLAMVVPRTIYLCFVSVSAWFASPSLEILLT
jgi:hypothetical protein